jgi:hypothetical protein
MAPVDEFTDEHRAQLEELFRTGNDPISFFCDVLADEGASIEDRRDAAEKLKPLYHPKLAKMGALLERFGN